MPVRTILDCDTGNEVDDQFAIAQALGQPEAFDLLGVVSVHNTLADGPASRDRYQREAERIVGMCGRDVTCVPGAAEPMPDGRTSVGSDGLEFIVDAAQTGPVTVVCTGPATDIASVLLAHPEVAGQLRVVWLGGFGDQASCEAHWVHELNGRADLPAWRVLLDADVQLCQVPGWSGPQRLRVETDAFSRRLRSLGVPAAASLADLLVEWVRTHGGSQDPPGHKTLWDLACVAVVADPAAVQLAPMAVPGLDGAGTHDFARRGRTIDVMTDLDPTRVLDACVDALARLPRDLPPSG